MIYVTLTLKNDESVLCDVVVMMFLYIYSWAMENRQSSNRFVVEPPAIEAAITGIQFHAGAMRLDDEAVSGGTSKSVSGAGVAVPEGADGGNADNAVEVDALIRAEEAAAAREAAAAAQAYARTKMDEATAADDKFHANRTEANMIVWDKAEAEATEAIKEAHAVQERANAARDRAKAARERASPAMEGEAKANGPR